MKDLRIVLEKNMYFKGIDWADMAYNNLERSVKS